MGIRHRKNGPKSQSLGKCNSNHNEISLHICWQAKIKRWTITSGDQDVEKLEPFDITGQNAEHHSYFGKQFHRSSKCLNIESYDPTISLLGNSNHRATQKLNYVHSSIIHKSSRWKQPSSSIDDWTDKMCYVQLMQYDLRNQYLFKE